MNTIKKLRTILQISEQKHLIRLFVLSIIFGFSESLGIGIIVPMLNLFLYPDKILDIELVRWLAQTLSLNGNFELMRFFVIVGGVLFILKFVFSLFMRYYQAYVNSIIHTRLASETMLAYLRKHYIYHIQHNSSQLFRNITVEINNFSGGFLTPVMQILVELFMVLSIFIFLLTIYPRETTFSVVFFAGISALLYLFTQNKIKKYSHERELYGNMYFKIGLEALAGVKDLQIYKVQTFFADLFRDSFWKAQMGFIKFSIFTALPRYFIETLVMLMFLAIMLISLVYQWDTIQWIPLLATLSLAAVRILPSIVSISQYVGSLQYYANTLDIVYAIHKDTKHFSSESPIQDIAQTNQKLTLQTVTFAYPNQAVFINQLTLSIAPHRTTALVGESGSGKSTLVDILMGLLEPQNGQVLYGETFINKENIESFRQKIGYVPQQIFLYDATLAENIAFGIPEKEIDNEKLEKAIELAQLTEVVKNLPQNVNTPIGEKGVRLSGGQRQRIGIARALYRQPEILIFDEATAALDNNTEVEVNRAIKSLQNNVTIILVAHRLQTIQQADYIYVLDKGKIADEGTFEQLQNQSSIFQKITQTVKN